MFYLMDFKIVTTLLIVVVGIGVDSKAIDNSNQIIVPPAPKHQGIFSDRHAHQTIANQIKSWKDTDVQNVWEMSGLFEGDIMLDIEEEDVKNGLINTKYRWPGGVVPYHIEESDFDEADIKVIKGAMEEYHQNTCIRFRPYNKTDIDYITIEGKNSGCWSYVGRLGKGQVVNLQNPGCVRHGTVVHELMHAIGFYHQQSAADRDEWVTINWQNIQSGKEHNFNKYDDRTVTDYGIGYDYTSVMHYSSHAFSKNKEPTITPKKDNVEIGQRKGLSVKDLLKVVAMYKNVCKTAQVDSTDESSEDLSFTIELKGDSA
ncbi:zinc metalloproteinase nas-13 [Ceratina calcarata]|uniref:Metalloendopeptidase n=1 Tax=Ceratina calcarata TaxID=156304 RepID=A0AAJ7JDP8_9HYME|nr:zinc metalloproteinase nas-13 [Ceratina calcarata]